MSAWQALGMLFVFAAASFALGWINAWMWYVGRHDARERDVDAGEGSAVG